MKEWDTQWATVAARSRNVSSRTSPSGYPQTMRGEVFGDMGDFAVVIFDSILLGHTSR